MRRAVWMRIGLVGAVVIGALIYLYPPPVIRGYLYGPEPPTRKGGLLPATLNLGLDLQGGIHLVLGVQTDKAIANEVDRTAEELKSLMEKRGIAVSRIAREDNRSFGVELSSPQSW